MICALSLPRLPAPRAPWWPVLVALAACGMQPTGAGGQAAPASGVTVTASVRSLVVPANLVVPTFAGIHAAFVSFESLADVAATSPQVLATATVQSASPSCAEEGCNFYVSGVDLTAAHRGLFAQVTASGGPADAHWQGSYAMVANSNQLTLSNQGHAPLAAFAPALLPSVDTVANLAKLAGLTPATMLARGATLAFVSATRSDGDTRHKGVGNAFVALVAADSGTLLLYPSDDYRQVQRTGTNVDGAVLVVGPPAAAQPPTSYATEVHVRVPTNAALYPDSAVILRPGAFVVLPLLPLR